MCVCVSLSRREQPIFTTRAHVFQIDPTTKKNWVPASKLSVTVSYFYDSTRNSYRIISVDGSKVRQMFTHTSTHTHTHTLIISLTHTLTHTHTHWGSSSAEGLWFMLPWRFGSVPQYGGSSDDVTAQTCRESLSHTHTHTHTPAAVTLRGQIDEDSHSH